MSRLINQLSPNLRLQRTRLRAPLSRKPLGATRSREAWAVCYLVLLSAFVACAAARPAGKQEASNLVQLPPGMKRYVFSYSSGYPLMGDPARSWTLELDPSGRAILHAFGMSRPNGTYEASISPETLSQVNAELEQLRSREPFVCVSHDSSFTVRDRAARVNVTACLPTIRSTFLVRLYDLAVTIVESATWSLSPS